MNLFDLYFFTVLPLSTSSREHLGIVFLEHIDQVRGSCELNNLESVDGQNYRREKINVDRVTEIFQTKIKI